MNVIIFDTETTDINKCFCYNIGYIIADFETNTILCKKDFVVEQIWHNLPLFSTAYYAEKRPLYVKALKARKTKMLKFGYICQEMIRDIKKFDVSCGYAYNSPFDVKVFDYNCNWFKCSNPLDLIPVFDIMGNVHNSLIDNNYFEFCERNQRFTESGNYSTTAESLYQYISNDIDFVEEHTALSDSIIEYEILKKTIEKGTCLMVKYERKRTFPRKQKRTFTVKDNKNNIVFSSECYGYTHYKKDNTIKLK